MEDFEELISKLNKDFAQEVNERVNQLQKCVSRMTIENNRNSDKKKEKGKYFELVGDPCYKYNRLAKETFLKDKACAFLFQIA